MLKKIFPLALFRQQIVHTSTPMVCTALESRLMLSSSADDPNDQISEAELVSFGDSIAAEIVSGDDVNMYEIVLTGGQTVELDVDSDAFVENLDSILQVYDANGNGLGYNDDGNSGDEITGVESFILFTPEESGSYFVAVSGFGNFYDAVEGDDDSFGGKKFFAGGVGGYGDTGEYILNFNLIDDAVDADDQITEATDLDSAGDSVLNASIDAEDVDMYRVWLDGGQEISVDIDSDSFASNLNSYVRLFDDQGFMLAFNDVGFSGDEVTGDESYLEYQAFEPGYYYIGVSGSGNATYDAQYGDDDVVGSNTGSYDLNVSTLNVLSVVQDIPNDALRITGGFGNDLIEVRSTVDGVRVLFDGVDQGSYTLNGNSEIFINALNGDDEVLFQTSVSYTAIVAAGSGNDTVRTGSGHDFVYGDGGVDLIFGRDGDDTLLGGDGNDRIFGQAGFDYLDGENDDDRLVGGTDDDGLFGGYGVDTLLGNAGGDFIFGDWQADDINGGSGDDYIVGGSASDTIRGIGGSDEIHGSSGNDYIEGNGGPDFIYGELGDDIILGGNGGDLIRGGFGNDDIDGGVAIDTIYGNNGDDVLKGGNDADFIYGGYGMDEIDGGGGIDMIFGDEGDDTINAGAGNDVVDGGDDNDTIDGEGGDDQIAGNAGDDTLTGGFGIDILDGGVGFDTALDIGETEISIEA